MDSQIQKIILEKKVKPLITHITSKMGMELKDVRYSDVKYKCSSCSGNVPHLVLLQCKHTICPRCSDELYDDNTNENFLYQCPICKEEIQEISYL